MILFLTIRNIFVQVLLLAVAKILLVVLGSLLVPQQPAGEGEDLVAPLTREGILDCRLATSFDTGLPVLVPL